MYMTGGGKGAQDRHVSTKSLGVERLPRGARALRVNMCAQKSLKAARKGENRARKSRTLQHRPAHRHPGACPGYHELERHGLVVAVRCAGLGDPGRGIGAHQRDLFDIVVTILGHKNRSKSSRQQAAGGDEDGHQDGQREGLFWSRATLIGLALA